MDTNLDRQIDEFWTSLQSDAIHQAFLLGFSDDMQCWDEVVAAFMRRTIAVRRMASLLPFTAEWNQTSARIAAAEAIIYSHTGAR